MGSGGPPGYVLYEDKNTGEVYYVRRDELDQHKRNKENENRPGPVRSAAMLNSQVNPSHHQSVGQSDYMKYRDRVNGGSVMEMSNPDDLNPWARDRKKQNHQQLQKPLPNYYNQQSAQH